MRIQSRHCDADRGLDAYFTPPEAVWSLINLEHLPDPIWEPAAGDGAIVRVLLEAGYQVYASDIADYGLSKCRIGDYFKVPPPPGAAAIVTNPPFKLAAEFALKALSEVPYVALLLRTNFLEGVERCETLFHSNAPTRIWISSARLPMMHRAGWAGKISTSNTCHAWFIWQRGAEREPLRWFDWHAVGKKSVLLCL